MLGRFGVCCKLRDKAAQKKKKKVDQQLAGQVQKGDCRFFSENV